MEPARARRPPPADLPRVRRLLGAQFPAWAHLPLRPVASSGTDNLLVRLGEDMVVRLPCSEWAVGALATELEWLPRLAPQLPFPVPEPLGAGTPGEGYRWPWAVYRWLPGDPVHTERIADPAGFGADLAADLAAFVRALRGILGGGPAPGSGSRGGPLAQRDELTRASLAGLRGRVDAEAVVDAWGASLTVAPWEGHPVLLHGDLTPGNVLVRAGRLAAVIDFGDLVLGDPAVDLLPAWNLLPADARAAYRAALDVDDATWLRGRGWALSIAVVALRHHAAGNPGLAAMSRRVVDEVLADAAERGR